EADLLLSAAPPYQQPVSPEFCPFQKDKLCTAREPRPLGCRVYFCDPAYQETCHQITETYLGKLKALAEEQGIEWRYAPLHEFLNMCVGAGAGRYSAGWGKRSRRTGGLPSAARQNLLGAHHAASAFSCCPFFLCLDDSCRRLAAVARPEPRRCIHRKDRAL